MSEAKHITQIISLPRSRTAWLSVALTAGSCFAFHDAVNPPSPRMTAEDYLQKLNSPLQKHVVDCSSALIVRHDLIEAANCPIIIIERDIDEARDSFCKHIGDARRVNGIWDAISSGFDELRAKFARRITLTVGFSELSRNDVIGVIQDIVSPGVEFDPQRLSVLQNLNIQERKPTWAGH